MDSKKVNLAIARIEQAYEIAQSMGNTLICAYSGGKDSDTLLDLCLKSKIIGGGRGAGGINFAVEHNHTTVDVPVTVRHIREVFKKLEGMQIKTKINMPDMSMWKLIVKNTIPPLRQMRYCCEHLKERKFENQHILTGIRWDESSRRKKRGLHETLVTNKKI